MKKLCLFAIPAFCILAAFSGCREQQRINMNQVARIEDSIPHIVPGARSIHTLQDDDYSKVTIIVGSPSFYKASDADKQQVAIRVGTMLMDVLGAGNSISTGTLILTQKDSNLNEVPADGIALDMKADSIKKAMYPNNK